jgi:riboflavin biosynthesis pyrimidine reductase
VATSQDLDVSLYAFPEVGRPWVRTNFVTTLDGAAHDTDGVTASLGGETDTALFAHLRSIADVILVGAGTARIERYSPDSPKPIVLVSRRLDIPDRLQVPGVTVVTTTDAPADRIAALRDAGVEVIPRGEIVVDWASVLDAFAARGWLKINCEGGPSLHGELITQNLVDDLCLTVAPVLTAGDAPRIAHSQHAVAVNLQLAHAVPVGDVLFTRWVRQGAGLVSTP